jgi:protein-disulfide isomerase
MARHAPTKREIIMAKRARRKRKRKTNWMTIGGFIVGGIILFGALLALAQRTPTQLRLDDYCRNNPENCISQGNPEAPVTVVEVSDYGCGHCANFNGQTAPLLEREYIENGKIHWVIVPFALGGQSGYPTLPTAVAAFCANEQGAFAEFHHQVFTLQQTPLFNTRQGFLQTAVSLGIDGEAFASCLDSNDYTQMVMDNITIAQRAGVSSTPTFFINGARLNGNYPFDVFQQRIDSLLVES